MVGRSTMVAGSTLLALVLLAADAGRSFEPPPPSAPPEAVLEAYFLAFEAGDCTAARALWADPSVVGSGELCGAADLSRFTILGERDGQLPGQVIFATILETGGSYDGSLGTGAIPRDYYVERQPNGAWRIVGAGMG